MSQSIASRPSPALCRALTDHVSSDLVVVSTHFGRVTACPLTGATKDYDRLLSRIGDAGFVLIGEGSHGTHDFYHERARITERLIHEKGFTAVAVEGDWPDAYRVNRYVRNASEECICRRSPQRFSQVPHVDVAQHRCG